MHNDMLSQIPSPCYVLEEARLRRNLQLIRSVKEAAGVNIILAFKAYALWERALLYGMGVRPRRPQDMGVDG